jgi:hypothetical protein
LNTLLLLEAVEAGVQVHPHKVVVVAVLVVFAQQRVLQ